MSDLGGVSAESSGCHGDGKQGSVFCPASSSLLSSYFWHFTVGFPFFFYFYFFFSAQSYAVILLQKRCSQMLRTFTSFTFPVVLCLLSFFCPLLRAFVGRDGGCRDQDGGCVVQEQEEGMGSLGFFFLFVDIFQKYILDSTLQTNTSRETPLLCPLSRSSHMLKTFPNKSVPLLNIDVIIPLMLSAYCPRLRSGFVIMNCNSTTIVKHSPTRTHPSLIWVSCCKDCCTHHS